MAGFGLRIILMACALLLGVMTVANLYTWSKLLRTVFFSQRRHLQRSIAKLETLKSEGFLQTLRQEVSNNSVLMEHRHIHIFTFTIQRRERRSFQMQNWEFEKRCFWIFELSLSHILFRNCYFFKNFSKCNVTFCYS